MSTDNEKNRPKDLKEELGTIESRIQELDGLERMRIQKFTMQQGAF